MEQGTRLIDISTDQLRELMEATVNRVLDARLPKTDPKYFTVKDLVTILGLSKETIWRLTREGFLPYKSLKGTIRKIRFTQEDIDNFLKANPAYKEKKLRNDAAAKDPDDIK